MISHIVYENIELTKTKLKTEQYLTEEVSI